MSLAKPLQELRVAILLPCYKRNEYTIQCIDSIKRCDKPCYVELFVYDDGSPDKNFFQNLDLSDTNAYLIQFDKNNGLRNVIIDFLDRTKDYFDFVIKIDNDCIVPANWITGMLNVFENSDVEILSPNVMPSNAALVHGRKDVDKKGYLPADIVGGLWMFRTSLIDDMTFEVHNTPGLSGAIPLLRQIVTEKDPVIGWTTDVVVEDVGHWSGKHPMHIKSFEHEIYSKEVGRTIAWNAEKPVTINGG